MTQYYLAIDGIQKGPFTKEQLRAEGLTGDTLVWRTGLTEWVAAGSMPELSDIFEETIVIDQTSPASPPLLNSDGDNGWFAMFGQRRVGPFSIDTLVGHGLTADTPVWHEGMTDWMPASQIAEIAVRLGLNPQSYYQPSDSGYGNAGNTPYPNKGYISSRKNYFTLSIIATVVGLIGCCIGAVVGIFAIIYANKANTLYDVGRFAEAEAANNTAKILCWITIAIGGLGIIGYIINLFLSFLF